MDPRFETTSFGELAVGALFSFIPITHVKHVFQKLRFSRARTANRVRGDRPKHHHPNEQVYLVVRIEDEDGFHYENIFVQ